MSVSAPAAVHTSRTPPMDGTAPDTRDGCTKIEAPMMVPTTMAVARPRPMARTNSGKAGKAIAAPMRPLHVRAEELEGRDMPVELVQPTNSVVPPRPLTSEIDVFG